MTDNRQSEALRLAEQYDYGDPVAHSNTWKAAVCNELRRMHAENAALQQGYDAARLEIDHLRGATKMMGAAGEYPPLPAPAFQLIWDGGRALYKVSKPNIGSTEVFTSDQLRAYVDATCAMRAAQAAPASQDAATRLKDGDIAALVNRLRDIAIEYSDTQQLRERIASEIRPRAAGLVGGGINKIDSQRILELTAQLAEAQRRIKELETPTMFWDFNNPEHGAFDSPYYAICDGDFDEGAEVSFMTARALPTKTVRVTRDSEGSYDYEYIDAAKGESNA